MKLRTYPFTSDELELTFFDLLNLLLGKKLRVSALKVSMKRLNKLRTN